MGRLQKGFMHLANAPPFQWVGMKCYIGGKTEWEAEELFKGLHHANLTPMIDLVGESVQDESSARAAAKLYIHWMKLCSQWGVRFFSLKPSHIGLGVDFNLTYDIASGILEAARALNIGVECDAEHPYLLEKTYNLACALKRGGGGFRRVAVPANQGCICRARIEGKRCTIPTVEFCIDRHLIDFNTLGIPIRVVKGAYHPGDIPDHIINSRFLTIAKTNRFSAGATHDFTLLLECFPYLEEVQMLYGIRMRLQMVLAKFMQTGRLLEWYLSERIKMGGLAGVSALSVLMPKSILTYVPLGPENTAIKYLNRRYEEGMQPNVFPLFLRNVPESLWWRLRYAPRTMFC